MCFGRTMTLEPALLGRMESFVLVKVPERLDGEGERASCLSPEFEWRLRRPERPGLLRIVEGRRGDGEGRGDSTGDTLDGPSSVPLEKMSPRPAPALMETKISSVLGR
jgi:hypothetical protein